ncbi:hypothetical protein H2200_007222 [Cladophialophora chaetospira]|uniref:Microsomal epoxide hydrolase n=1 Tax=Cladophialophora chaetospira TaxID=386627 RepID=A0AA39CH99_9EURO|nr:hypothetical protein H2200_007222 [Cladophialophora chaetospira]
MAVPQSRPKVLLFDIGGVCVVSPFQAILDYELQNNIPVGYINYNIRALTPNGAWHKLERGEIPNDANYFRMFKADLERPDLWARFHAEKLNVSTPPPVPSIDAETMYWNMMTNSRSPDPWMYPALLKLKAKGWKLAALSNTTVFPEGHAFNEPAEDEDVKKVFDVFVSSTHVGMRKPNRDIYEYTLKLLKERWGNDINFEDIVFFDDIGENLKGAKALGIRTVRVVLGKTKDAVRELERLTGLELVGEPWVSKPAKAKLSEASKAKL